MQNQLPLLRAGHYDPLDFSGLKDCADMCWEVMGKNNPELDTVAQQMALLLHIYEKRAAPGPPDPDQPTPGINLTFGVERERERVLVFYRITPPPTM